MFYILSALSPDPSRARNYPHFFRTFRPSASPGSRSWPDPTKAEAELLEEDREEAHEERVDEREELGDAQEDRPLDAVRRDAAVQGVQQILNLPAEGSTGGLTKSN